MFRNVTSVRVDVERVICVPLHTVSATLPKRDCDDPSAWVIRLGMPDASNGETSRSLGDITNIIAAEVESGLLRN